MTCAFPNDRTCAATKAIQQADAALQAKPNAKGKELLDQAKSLAYTPLVGEANVKDEQFLDLFRKSRRDVAVAKELTGMEQLWADKAKANYAKALQLANEAKGLAK